MTMKAVGTAAMEMVQEVEIQFDEVREIHISIFLGGCRLTHGRDGQKQRHKKRAS